MRAFFRKIWAWLFHRPKAKPKPRPQARLGLRGFEDRIAPSGMC